VDIEGMSEEERLAILVELAREHPGLTAPGAGVLAGRATPSRPAVPVWDYLAYHAANPDVSLTDLAAVRFPVVFYGGQSSTVTSINELLDPGPIPPTTVLTVESVIGMYAYLHDAGILGWNPETRAVEHLRPDEEYAAAVKRWGSTLR
jgi:hypothetical protein